MKPFLKTIAEAYSSQNSSDFSDFLFVFPNKRGGTFFLNYLHDTTDKEFLVPPEVTTISDFIENLSGYVIASRVDALFTLFNCYKAYIFSKNAENITETVNFDSFRTWGETVIADFDTVDQYMVDPESIFKNIKDFREIATDFLSEEQKEVLADFFGHHIEEYNTSFWHNFEEDEQNISEIKQKFIYLWRILYPLYELFHDELQKKGLTTTGHAYKLALKNLEEKEITALTFKKLVFVGFNALNTAELTIFKFLKSLKNSDGFPLSDFYWDYTGPILNGDHSASRFVKANRMRFPSPDWAKDFLKESNVNAMPQINVVSSPSNVAQTKIVTDLLIDLKNKIGEKEFADAKVAVVLPDESLLIPMLFSLGDSLGKVNLTMGYTFRLTDIFSLIRLIRRIMTNMTTEENEVYFFRNDLNIFISNPLAHILLDTWKVERLRGQIDKYHLYKISKSLLTEIFGDAAFIFDVPEKEIPHNAMSHYLENLLLSFADVLKKKENIFNSDVIQANILTCINELKIFNESLKEHDIKLSSFDFIKLFEKVIGGSKIMFEGEPLTGLQVMGTLETRSLDFDYIFVLSMNERVMPRRVHARSFIPNTLRRAYGIPAANYAEELFSYYFYRMISRVKMVTLLYDGRSAGRLKVRGVSRYILQLRHLYGKNIINESDRKFLISARESNDASVIKSPSIKKRLQKFSEPDGKNFSAAALNHYRQCEVKFYLRYLMNINDDPAPAEYIDAITIGNVVHAVMLDLYLPQEKKYRLLEIPEVITENLIESFIQNPGIIKERVKTYINKYFYHLDTDKCNPPLTGASEMIAQRIEQIINGILEYDKTLTPFNLFGGEIKETIRYKLPSGRVVNFTYAIDRLDEIVYKNEKRMRLVDYKTGSPHEQIKNYESLFGKGYEVKNFFQLFLYALLLRQKNDPRFENLLAAIYSLPSLKKGENGLLKIGSNEVDGFAPFKKDFESKLNMMIEEIFDKDSFEENEDESECSGCAFRAICGK